MSGFSSLMAHASELHLTDQADGDIDTSGFLSEIAFAGQTMVPYFKRSHDVLTISGNQQKFSQDMYNQFLTSRYDSRCLDDNWSSDFNGSAMPVSSIVEEGGQKFERIYHAPGSWWYNKTSGQPSNSIGGCIKRPARIQPDYLVEAPLSVCVARKIRIHPVDTDAVEDYSKGFKINAGIEFLEYNDQGEPVGKPSPGQPIKHDEGTYFGTMARERGEDKDKGFYEGQLELQVYYYGQDKTEEYGDDIFVKKSDGSPYLYDASEGWITLENHVRRNDFTSNTVMSNGVGRLRVFKDDVMIAEVTKDQAKIVALDKYRPIVLRMADFLGGNGQDWNSSNGQYHDYGDF